MEAYLAISKNQEHYDITVVTSDSRIVRLQVKTTELQNGSTNNIVKGIDKEYNFLILVVIDREGEKFYILPKERVNELREGDRLAISRRSGGSYVVRDVFSADENQWGRIAQ